MESARPREPGVWVRTTCFVRFRPVTATPGVAHPPSRRSRPCSTRIRAAPGPTRPIRTWRFCAGATASAPLADRRDRPVRGPGELRAARVHPRADGPGAPALSPLRHVLRHRAARTGGRHRPRLQGDRGGAPRRARARVGRPPGAAVRLVLLTRRARRGSCDRGRAVARGRARRARRSRAIGPRRWRPPKARPRGGARRRGLAHPGPGQDPRGSGRRALHRSSVVFADANGGRLEAGGFQSIEAYDVCIANLAPALARSRRPSDPIERSPCSPRGSRHRKWPR